MTIMTDIYEVSIFDSSDDDISLAAAEEVGLLSQYKQQKSPSSLSSPTTSHRRTSSIDQFVWYTKRTVRETLSDLDFIHNALSIALLAVLWHVFSLAISIVRTLVSLPVQTIAEEILILVGDSTINGCSPATASPSPSPSS